MPKKRPFIDKKNAISFHVVHRSQRDPLQASEDASRSVLVPVDISKTEKQREEQRKFGVFYEDEYNYMQHLYDINEVRPVHLEHVYDDVCILEEDEDGRPMDAEAAATAMAPSTSASSHSSLQLPSSVFPSSVETRVGLLNKAVKVTGPQPDWDPDIVAALDDDFDMDNPDNVLEDDFIAAANAPGQFDDAESDDAFSDADSTGAEFSDSGDENGEQLFMEEETKSRFTAYSMTSSVIRRNEGLTLLDDRFEKLFEDYDDSEIGALDDDDIEGGVTEEHPLMQHVMQEFEADLRKQQEESVIEGTGETIEEPDSGTETDESLEKLVIEKQDEKWDCESILSTYSNLYNHPRLIEEPSKKPKIELTSKLGIPRDSLAPTGLTRKQVEKEIRESRRADRASTYRPQGETPEEKRMRKEAIKAERKERRIEKKSNKMAFKEEEQRQYRQKINVITNIQGAKIT